MKKIESVIGILSLFIIIFLGGKFFVSGIIFLRLIVGLILGYALSRSFMGFAGSVNRAYRGGSTKLMRMLMFMFSISALISVAFLYNNTNASSIDLSVSPINFGLVIGAILFGFGMTFSSCCATGVLTDLPESFSKAIVTLFFLGIGVFLGFPIQSKASWVTKSWFTSEMGHKLDGGVYFPDLFKWDGLDGYLGASILTLILAGIVVWISYIYEDKKIKENNFQGIESEKIQYSNTKEEYEPFKLISQKTYDKIFVKPWTMETGAVVITIAFTLLTGITKGGWSASSPFGYWFGRILLKVGVPIDAITSFSTKPAKVFVDPLLTRQTSVQNIGIILGAIIYLLLADKLITSIKSGLKISLKEFFLFALGGIIMGIGTRMANGCNVGALYTPISYFSLSGWVFLVAMVIGGIIGNKTFKIIK